VLDSVVAVVAGSSDYGNVVRSVAEDSAAGVAVAGAVVAVVDDDTDTKEKES